MVRAKSDDVEYKEATDEIERIREMAVSVEGSGGQLHRSGHVLSRQMLACGWTERGLGAEGCMDCVAGDSRKKGLEEVDRKEWKRRIRRFFSRQCVSAIGYLANITRGLDDLSGGRTGPAAAGSGAGVDVSSPYLPVKSEWRRSICQKSSTFIGRNHCAVILRAVRLTSRSVNLNISVAMPVRDIVFTSVVRIYEGGPGGGAAIAQFSARYRPQIWASQLVPVCEDVLERGRSVLDDEKRLASLCNLATLVSAVGSRWSGQPSVHLAHSHPPPGSYLQFTVFSEKVKILVTQKSMLACHGVCSGGVTGLDRQLESRKRSLSAASLVSLVGSNTWNKEDCPAAGAADCAERTKRGDFIPEDSGSYAPTDDSAETGRERKRKTRNRTRKCATLVGDREVLDRISSIARVRSIGEFSQDG
ncbi:hypothetical protein AAG570_000899 [Ranatra chinensis]|uniref:Uncharacterized protein n=1 Tax=Ranatra chinensis TaxID=642074 RepID=A0ABD0YYE7_9HEMI